MHVLLTAATPFEIQPLIDYLKETEWLVNDTEVQLLISGVGSISTTFHLTYHTNQRRPDVVIQAGVAGSFQPDTTPEIVVVNEEIMGDLGVWENDTFKDIFDLNLAYSEGIPFTNKKLVNPYEKLLALTGLQAVRAITVNEISTNAKKIEWYQQNMAPIVESMEGAAFHYVCLQQNIPFVQLRGISNKIGERDKTKWEMGKAITGLNKKLITLLKDISQYDETYFRI